MIGRYMDLSEELAIRTARDYAVFMGEVPWPDGRPLPEGWTLGASAGLPDFGRRWAKHEDGALALVQSVPSLDVDDLDLATAQLSYATSAEHHRRHQRARTHARRRNSR